MTTDNIINDFAQKQTQFTAQDLYNYCLSKGECSLAYLRKRLMMLVKKEILARPERGVYSLSKKSNFNPILSNNSINLYSLLTKQYPYTKFCIYEGEWITPLLHHLAPNQITYIEVEKDASESIFHFLQKKEYSVYYKPDIEMIYRYIDLSKESIFIKNLISEAPLETIQGVPTSSLEKLLVDIYVDSDFFYLQGGEYFNIAENAKEIFNLNKTKLLRYASRRGVRKELEKIYY